MKFPCILHLLLLCCYTSVSQDSCQIYEIKYEIENKKPSIVKGCITTIDSVSILLRNKESSILTINTNAVCFIRTENGRYKKRGAIMGGILGAVGGSILGSQIMRKGSKFDLAPDLYPMVGGFLIGTLVGVVIGRETAQKRYKYHDLDLK